MVAAGAGTGGCDVLTLFLLSHSAIGPLLQAVSTGASLVETDFADWVTARFVDVAGIVAWPTVRPVRTRQSRLGAVCRSRRSDRRNFRSSAVLISVAAVSNRQRRISARTAAGNPAFSRMCLRGGTRFFASPPADLPIRLPDGVARRRRPPDTVDPKYARQSNASTTVEDGSAWQVPRRHSAWLRTFWRYFHITFVRPVDVESVTRGHVSAIYCLDGWATRYEPPSSPEIRS